MNEYRWCRIGPCPGLRPQTDWVPLKARTCKECGQWVITDVREIYAIGVKVGLGEASVC